ncbi:unnamed protein product [Polarella glacialis]|uniref:Uncharacterized protein n=1 Tax=Polarella glacialis TaxID=89957 RepID=A0A813HV24_POLGL|nr:unnamed protein product [Polarella glacialis]
MLISLFRRSPEKVLSSSASQVESQPGEGPFSPDDQRNSDQAPGRSAACLEDGGPSADLLEVCSEHSSPTAAQLAEVMRSLTEEAAAEEETATDACLADRRRSISADPAGFKTEWEEILRRALRGSAGNEQRRVHLDSFLRALGKSQEEANELVLAIGPHLRLAAEDGCVEIEHLVNWLAD